MAETPATAPPAKKMSSRMLKELRALTPFSWDTKGAPLGPAMTADFDKIDAVFTNPSTGKTRRDAALRDNSTGKTSPEGLDALTPHVASSGPHSSGARRSGGARTGVRAPKRSSGASGLQPGSSGALTSPTMPGSAEPSTVHRVKPLTFTAATPAPGTGPPSSTCKLLAPGSASHQLTATPALAKRTPMGSAGASEISEATLMTGATPVPCLRGVPTPASVLAVTCPQYNAADAVEPSPMEHDDAPQPAPGPAGTRDPSGAQAVCAAQVQAAPAELLLAGADALPKQGPAADSMQGLALPGGLHMSQGTLAGQPAAYPQAAPITAAAPEAPAMQHMGGALPAGLSHADLALPGPDAFTAQIAENAGPTVAPLPDPAALAGPVPLTTGLGLPCELPGLPLPQALQLPGPHQYAAAPQGQDAGAVACPQAPSESAAEVAAGLPAAGPHAPPLGVVGQAAPGTGNAASVAQLTLLAAVAMAAQGPGSDRPANNAALINSFVAQQQRAAAAKAGGGLLSQAGAPAGAALPAKPLAPIARPPIVLPQPAVPPQASRAGPHAAPAPQWSGHKRPADTSAPTSMLPPPPKRPAPAPSQGRAVFGSVDTNRGTGHALGKGGARGGQENAGRKGGNQRQGKGGKAAPQPPPVVTHLTNRGQWAQAPMQAPKVLAPPPMQPPVVPMVQPRSVSPWGPAHCPYTQAIASQCQALGMAPNAANVAQVQGVVAQLRALSPPAADEVLRHLLASFHSFMAHNNNHNNNTVVAATVAPTVGSNSQAVAVAPPCPAPAIAAPPPALQPAKAVVSTTPNDTPTQTPTAGASQDVKLSIAPLVIPTHTPVESEWCARLNPEIVSVYAMLVEGHRQLRDAAQHLNTGVPRADSEPPVPAPAIAAPPPQPCAAMAAARGVAGTGLLHPASLACAETLAAHSPHACAHMVVPALHMHHGLAPVS